MEPSLEAAVRAAMAEAREIVGPEHSNVELARWRHARAYEHLVARLSHALAVEDHRHATQQADTERAPRHE